jgi:hypothetical protein
MAHRGIGTGRVTGTLTRPKAEVGGLPAAEIYEFMA